MADGVTVMPDVVLMMLFCSGVRADRRDVNIVVVLILFALERRSS